MDKQEWMQSFSNNLKTILKKENITQRKLAQLTGIPDSSISYYINCNRMISLANVINISYALDCSIDELVDFGDIIE